MESWRKITVTSTANYIAPWNQGMIFHLNDGLGEKYLYFSQQGIYHYDEAIYDVSDSTSNGDSVNYISVQTLYNSVCDIIWAMN